MKALALPIVLLLFCASCEKQQMPTPVDANVHLSQARITGDYVEKIAGDPAKHPALTNEVGPKKPSIGSASRVSGDTTRKITLNPGERPPLPNGGGPRR